MRELLLKNRSYRRFKQDQRIPRVFLHELIENTRYCASAANKQPLRYLALSDSISCEKAFSCLSWAGYLPDWPGPDAGERPSGYIILAAEDDEPRAVHWDAGIAAQTILLSAAEHGFGGCIFASIRRDQLAAYFPALKPYKVVLAIALGVPAEEVVIDDIQADDVKYWRDAKQVHHVPKRTLKELML
jgi:nitroreductase